MFAAHLYSDWRILAEILSWPGAAIRDADADRWRRRRRRRSRSVRVTFVRERREREHTESVISVGAEMLEN